MRVVVPELNLREDPTINSKILATLRRGEVFLIGSTEDVVADGYAWWWGDRLEAGSDGALPRLPGVPQFIEPTGYIAVRKGETPYVERLPARCPPTADLPHLAAMLPFERLECFGPTTLLLEGTFGCPFCEGLTPYRFEPRWLAATQLHRMSVPNGMDRAWSPELHFPPELPVPEPGDILRLRGHFDDPRSSECSITFLGPDDPDFHTVDPAIAEATCRTHLVVEEYEVIGRDPEAGAY